MKKKRIVIISMGALLLAAAGIFLFCISHKEKAQVSKEPVERQLQEEIITASGLTSVGMNTEILKLDFLSTELYVEESYLSVGDEVEAGTKVFKISEETLKEAKKELSDKVTETELAYRQGVIDYEADLLEADSTYQKASISAAYAQTNYDKQEAEEKQKVKDLQEQVEQARELLEEYHKSEEEDYYRTYYQIDELYEEYYEHFQLLMSFYEKWDVEELSGEEQTGNGEAQMMTMGNQAGSGDTEKLSVYQELDELVTQEGEEYQTALENYEKAKATAEAGLKKAESDLTDLEAQLTQAQTEYEQNLIEYKAEYDTALAENEDAELIYSTTKQSLEETLEDLKDEMEEAKENQDSFLEALSDGCFYTEKAGTIVVNAVTDDTYLSGNTLVIAYSNPETVSITAQVDQDDIAQILSSKTGNFAMNSRISGNSADISTPAVASTSANTTEPTAEGTQVDIVYAACNGTVITLKEVADGVFSEGYIGEGFAIEPVDGSFYAPFDGTIAMVFDTHHAIALHSANDTELILHVGLDTVKLNGQHLEVFVEEGQKIEKGDLILRADLKGIASAGYRTVTPVVITGASGAESVELLRTGPVHIGDAVLKVHY